SGSVQVLEGIGDFMIGGFVEGGEADVADVRFDEERDIHGMARDFAAGYGEGELLRIAFPGDDDFYDGALLTLQHVCDFGRSQAVGGFVVNLDDDIARAQAGVICRCADIRGHNNGVVFARSDNHADAVVAATLILAKQGELAGVKEIRVGVENAEHAGDRALIDFLVDIHRLCVVGLDHVQDASELLYGGLVVISRRGGGADGRAVNTSQNSRYEQHQND